MEKGTQTLLDNYVSIYERPNKKCSTFTDEEKTERARTSTRNHYFNIEREREREHENEQIIIIKNTV